MSSRFRLLFILALGVVLLTLPTGGLAADPNRGSSHAEPQVVPPVVPATLAYTAVPGASVLTVGTADSYAYATSAGATLVGVSTSVGYFWYNSSLSDVLTSLRLPAGATIWQIDAYGYLTGTGTQTWRLEDENPMVGGTTSVAATATSPSSTGVTQTTMSFSSGLTLAVGHHLLLDLSTSTSAGYVGAVVQYTLPTLSFVPISPTRVLDTRNGTGGLSGPFSNHVARTFQVTGGSSGVPTGAKAVTGNLTVTGQTSSGYLYVGPVAMNNPTSSTLNFPVGDDRANGVTVALGAGGTLSITFVAPSNGPTAQAIFDVTGYYQ